MFGGKSTVDKVLMELVEHTDVFNFGAVLHRGSENGIAVVDIAYQNVFIPAGRGDGEMASEVGGNFGAEFGDGGEYKVCFGVRCVGGRIGI